MTMDLFYVSKFPFINSASKYINIKLEEVIYDNAFQNIRELATKRVINSIRGDDIDFDTEPIDELLSYPVSRILVSCINDSYLIHRYGLIEAKSANKKMKNLQDEILHELINELNLDFKIKNKSYQIHFSNYLLYAPKENRWKLVNRKMNHGFVFLNKNEVIRIMEQAVKKKVESNLPFDIPTQICEALSDYIIEIEKVLNENHEKVNITELKNIKIENYPPCITYAISELRKGVNLTHSMRFALTSFLLNIGVNTEYILQLFNVSPDFDEERTRYQIEHIKGSSGTVYKPLSCSKMITYGNCHNRDEICDKISHPLGYIKKKILMNGN